MNLPQLARVVARGLFPMAMATFLVVATAQTAAPVSPASAAAATATGGRELVTLSLDRDLVTFIQYAGAALGVFLVAFGWVFGVDIMKTRTALLEAREDIASRREAIRTDHQALDDLKDRLLKLGAVLEGEIEKVRATLRDAAVPGPDKVPKPPEQEPRGALTELWELQDKKRERIREVLAASEFEWSTIGTVEKKTKLSWAEIQPLIQDDPFIQVGHGQQGATLLRLKEFNFPGGLGSAYSATKIEPVGFGARAGKAFRDALAQHAQEGKRPSGKVLGGE